VDWELRELTTRLRYLRTVSYARSRKRASLSLQVARVVHPRLPWIKEQRHVRCSCDHRRQQILAHRSTSACHEGLRLSSDHPTAPSAQWHPLRATLVTRGKHKRCCLLTTLGRRLRHQARCLLQTHHNATAVRLCLILHSVVLS
jgi:hypothetical protein